MTPKQRRFLGIACSKRVEQLLDRLEMLAGRRTIFDRNIVTDPIFGTAGGQYHSGESAPRISLPERASEITAAHEVLHGILDYEHYPQFNAGYRKRFPFICDVLREVAHCAMHVVIDFRLHAMGYDIRAERAERAEVRMAGLAQVRAGLADMQLEHWWCIRVAEEIATYASCPTDTTGLADHFTAAACQHLPRCLGLADRFTTIVQAMKVDDPRNVQLSLRQMLAAVEAEYGSYPYFINLQRLALIGPIFVTRKQLDEPATNSVRIEVGILQNRDRVRNGTIVVVADKFSGATWSVATSESLDDEKKIELAVEDLAKEPLEGFLRYLQVKYVEQ